VPVFLIRVTRDEQGKIISLYSPDFAPELLEYGNDADINDNYNAFIKNIFTTLFLKHLTTRPKTLKELGHINVTSLQRWEFFTINYQSKSGFFSRSLPILGHVANILGMLARATVTFMALRIASSNNNDDDSSSSTALSIFGTVLSSTISVIIYIYSDATEMLTDLGQSIDKRFDKMCRQDYEAIPTNFENGNPRSTFSKKVIPLLAVGAISTNTLIAGISTYQECILLVDKYLNLYPDISEAEREKYRELLRWLVVNILVFIGSYTTLAFQGSFATAVVEDLINKFELNDSIERQDDQFSENTNNGIFFQYPNASSSNMDEPSALQSTDLRHLRPGHQGL